MADARLDARQDLLAELKGTGSPVDSNATNAELLLHAYHAWGESCVQHVIGDFSFAIWDPRRESLFCARDHFGACPLYHAEVDGGLIVSNTLDCVRAHPAVTDRLNEAAIGDYLLFGFNHDRRTTVFADVRKIPPAHALTWSNGVGRTRRYWDPSDRERDRVDPAEVVVRFADVYRQAIEDRLIPGPMAILMSGGLDSTSIAALAKDSLPDDATLTGHVTGFSRLMPYEEPALAGIVAERLAIPLRSYDGDAFLFERTGPDAWFAPPEPRFSLHVSPGHEILEGVATDGNRVALLGIGGDPALRGDRSAQRNRLRARLKRGLARVRPPAFDDSWLDPDFVRRVDLRDRWREIARRTAGWTDLRSMTDHPMWENVLSSAHPEFSGKPVIFRQPFFDVRLWSFLLSVPPQPWLRKKWLLREAMRGTLPDSIVDRPKTILPAEYYQALATRQEDPWLEKLARARELAAYVAREPLLAAIRAPETVRNSYLKRVIYPLGLGFWLRDRASLPSPAAPTGGSTVEPHTPDGG